MIKKITILYLSFFPLLSLSNNYENEDLSLTYGDLSLVSIATGTLQPINKAPAAVTVITSRDISQLGASDLDDVLLTVPGLYLNNDFLRSNKYIFRGIYTTSNAEALLLINGIPVRNLINGNNNYFWGGMPVNAIAKIEIIRGPGSALYGADAFGGVINIWTKQASDINGWEAGLRIASYKTNEAWLQYGGKISDLELAISAEWLRTDGHKQIIEMDAQSYFDEKYNTNFSNAPGPANLQLDSLELRIDTKFKNIQLRAGLQQRDNMGTGTGLVQALDNNGRVSNSRHNVDATYTRDEVVDGLRLELQSSFYHVEQKVTEYTLLYPAGAFNNQFPNGVIGTPEWKQYSFYNNLFLHYSGFDEHTILFSIGFEKGSVDKVKEQRNYSGFGNSLIEVDLYTLDSKDTFIPEKNRENSHILLQDEWQLAPDWQLIAGLRYDSYSDFGDTTNPRLALVWNTHFNLTTKLLYGSAFRAPSFNDLYAQGIPYFGNEDIKPQSIDAYELVFNYQYSTTLLIDFNIFYNYIDDLISYDKVQVANSGRIISQGAEVTFDYSGFDDWILKGNYAYQHSVDKTQSHPVGYAPNHELFLLADWQISDNINIVNKLLWVGKRLRPKGDLRQPLAGFAQWDLLFNWQINHQNINLMLGIYNVADADIKHPSINAHPEGVPSDNFAVSIPQDIPQAGRNFSVKLSYKF